MRDARCDGAASVFSFPEAEAPKVEAERSLRDCFVMQVAAKYSADESGSEVIELVE